MGPARFRCARAGEHSPTKGGKGEKMEGEKGERGKEKKEEKERKKEKTNVEKMKNATGPSFCPSPQWFIQVLYEYTQ